MKRLHLLFGLCSALLLFACGSDDSEPSDDMMDIDSQSPTAPLNLVINNVTETSVDLSWDAATDNVAVTGYEVFRDDVSLQSVTGTTLSVTGLSPCNDYNFYVVAKDAEDNVSEASDTAMGSTLIGELQFRDKLSEMCIFQGDYSEIDPREGVQLYELNSTLFTDYAKKQRLVRLPKGEKMTYNGSDLLPNFPDNTLVAKTFYYNLDDRDPSLGQQIIETRVFIKLNGVWEVGDYIWNSDMTDAIYSEAGMELPISFIDNTGTTNNVNYEIPSKQDCFTCHNNNDETFPIGMKLRNMNFVPSYTSMNQLDYLTSNNFLDGVNSGSTSQLPDWTDDALSLEERARGYMDINCAHCHSPGGSVPDFYMLDLRLEVPYADSGIEDSRLGIKARFESVVPFFRMPQLGRTVRHDEAIIVLNEYLDSL